MSVLSEPLCVGDRASTGPVAVVTHLWHGHCVKINDRKQQCRVAGISASAASTGRIVGRVLHAYPVPHRSDVVAQVRGASGLDAREHDVRMSFITAPINCAATQPAPSRCSGGGHTHVKRWSGNKGGIHWPLTLCRSKQSKRSHG